MLEFYGFKTDKIKYQKKSSKIWQIFFFDYNIYVIMNQWFKKFMLIQMRSFTNYVTGKCTPFALAIFAECANHSIRLFMNPHI